MQTKYKTLVNILDQIRESAPEKYKRYKPDSADIEKINQARARAYIHLYLKVNFGLLQFEEREHFITDGTGDGGIDAYYIDVDNKRVVYIQSKFRTNSDNFSEKDIDIKEILAMELDRILEGEENHENGTPYSGKIKQLQREISSINDIGRYKYEIVILANLKGISDHKIKKITGGFPTIIYDHEKAYNDLVFPVVSGTYYSEDELVIKLNLQNSTSSSSRIGYSVETNYKECDISIVFAPTLEIGKILYKYKNTILKYNPRSYLELSKNNVNKDIAKTIKENAKNEFALFNNGITLLSEDTNFNEKVGKKDTAQVIVTNPQIINGGQSAYTLSRIYQEVLDGKVPETVFEGKEVLLKIITFSKENNDDINKRIQLIEDISKATNSQTPVDDADRRSNDKLQHQIQSKIFTNHGLYYERKRGEFSDGLKDKYIKKDQIIERETLLRIAHACNLEVSKSRRNSAKQLFSEDNINKLFSNISKLDTYMFGYLCLQELNKIESKYPKRGSNQYNSKEYGEALRYGKYSVVAACTIVKNDEIEISIFEIVIYALEKWILFEEYVVNQKSNKAYFKTIKDPANNMTTKKVDFGNYYKGRTISTDIKSFFKNYVINK